MIQNGRQEQPLRQRAHEEQEQQAGRDQELEHPGRKSPQRCHQDEPGTEGHGQDDPGLEGRRDHHQRRSDDPGPDEGHPSGGKDVGRVEQGSRRRSRRRNHNGITIANAIFPSD